MLGEDAHESTLHCSAARMRTKYSQLKWYMRGQFHALRQGQCRRRCKWGEAGYAEHTMDIQTS